MPDSYVEIASAARSSAVDAAALAEALRGRLRGEVRFDEGSRALYATDGSNYRQVPIGVVIPRDVDDVIATISLAREYGAPVLCRGGGTSLAGQCCNVAVILDFTKLHGRHSGDRSSAPHRPGTARSGSRPSARRRRETSSDLRVPTRPRTTAAPSAA